MMPNPSNHQASWASTAICQTGPTQQKREPSRRLLSPIALRTLGRAFVFPEAKAMTDRLSPERRSWTMSRIRSKDTSPELRVRSLIHRAGYRFRLHVSGMPGKPDIVMPRYRTAIFVDGCYWHQHPGCRRATMPKTNVPYWQSKFERNAARDQEARTALREVGWTPLTVWECQTKNDQVLADTLSELLPPRYGKAENVELERCEVQK